MTKYKGYTAIESHLGWRRLPCETTAHYFLKTETGLVKASLCARVTTAELASITSANPRCPSCENTLAIILPFVKGRDTRTHAEKEKAHAITRRHTRSPK